MLDTIQDLREFSNKKAALPVTLDLDFMSPSDEDLALDSELSTLTRTGTLTESAAATTGPSGTGAMKTIVGTFTLVADATVTEVGLFDDTAAGAEMFSRIVLGTPISAGGGDTVTITYIIEVG